MKLITIETINSVLNGTIIGKTNQLITAPEQLEAAKESEITFIGNKKYENFGRIQKLQPQLLMKILLLNLEKIAFLSK